MTLDRPLEGACAVAAVESFSEQKIFRGVGAIDQKGAIPIIPCGQMAEIAWWRAGELGNLVRVLEFGAVNLHHRARIAELRRGGGLNRPRLA